MALAELRPEMKAAVEQTLQDILDFRMPPRNHYALMLYYHMGWEHCGQPEVIAGKRTRPLITLLCAAAAGGDWKSALPFAAGVELIHNFSLVHDDIQDASPLRRGRATVWSLWGRDQAINAGDALFAYAHLAVERAAGLPPEARLGALQLLDEACIALTLGQHLDMDFERREMVSVDEYVEMVDCKTAALIAAAAELGALAVDAPRPVQAQYRDFGRRLGLAFQMRDDVLGIWGDSAVTGKSAATDIETRKKTLPIVYALARSPELAAAYAPAEAGGADTASIVAILEACEARTYAEAVEQRHGDLALEALSTARPVGRAGEALHELTRQLLGRAQ